MRNSFNFHSAVALSLLIILAYTGDSPLLYKIQSTKKLIDLYQQKLALLLQLAKNQNLNIQDTLNDQSDNSTLFDGLFKLQKQEQYAFQVDLGIQIQYGMRFVEPGFFIISGLVLDAKNMEVRQVLNGEIVAVEPYMITTWIDGATLQIYRLSQKITVSEIPLRIQNKPGKWHHATAFPDIFTQTHLNSLTLSTQSGSPPSPLTLKSQILQTFSIHQYKMLYICKHSLGYINPKSQQITGQINFQTVVQTGYYSRIDGFCFILFKNRTISLFVNQVLVGTSVTSLGIEGATIVYFGGYLFVKAGGIGCFQVFQVGGDGGVVFFREVCLPGVAENCSQSACHNSEFQYQFFKYNGSFRVILNRKDLNVSQVYQISLPEREPASERWFPWKVIIVLVGVAAVVYYRSANKPKSKQATFGDHRPQRRSVKKVKRDKEDVEEEQEYIREVNQEIKRLGKKLDIKKFD